MPLIHPMLATGCFAFALSACSESQEVRGVDPTDEGYAAGEASVEAPSSEPDEASPQSADDDVPSNVEGGPRSPSAPAADPDLGDSGAPESNPAEPVGVDPPGVPVEPMHAEGDASVDGEPEPTVDASSPVEEGEPDGDDAGADTTAPIPQQPCLAKAECGDEGPQSLGQLTCFAPYEPHPIGTPPFSECTTDDECTDGRLCVTNFDESFCSRPCQEVGCPLQFDALSGVQAGLGGKALSCADDGHCRPTSCVDAAACPVNFDCIGGVCERRSCAGPDDCAADSPCVNGSCHEATGTCDYKTAA